MGLQGEECKVNTPTQQDSAGRKEENMRDYTRFLKEESKKDLVKYDQHNNAKERKRTSEQNEQCRKDKAMFYRTKWENLLSKCETPAQKDCCENMLNRLKYIR